MLLLQLTHIHHCHHGNTRRGQAPAARGNKASKTTKGSENKAGRWAAALLIPANQEAGRETCRTGTSTKIVHSSRTGEFSQEACPAGWKHWWGKVTEIRSRAEARLRLRHVCAAFTWR